MNQVKTEGGWKLSAMRFNFKFAAGNPKLAAEAQRRAAASK